jgi:ribosomal protein S18 acetylase RimI-like enzyme
MTENKIQIEIATISDAIKILEIQKAAFLDQARIYNKYQLPPLTQSLESIEDEFNNKTFLKVMLNGQIVASVRFKLADGCVTIDRIVVKPEFQNQGIGTTLLKEIESKVPNAEAFQLFTGNKSDRNLHLYEKMGYKVIKRKKTDQGIELLYLEKRL